ncbi:MAG: H-type lectin domain-containing protein [Trichodesmium sp. St18_bin1]|nr:H-type lectin domain-containing protein [Trichodesmium sp. St18_bin1]MDE5119355.1 H-type lectin domain-containing protein [Trichodesmium sp. St19_bin1]
MKKIVWLFSLILCLVTFVISPSAWADEGSSFYFQEVDEFQVQGGNLLNSESKNPETWTLFNGIRERKFTSHVHFPKPYQQVPIVVLSLSGFNQQGCTDSIIVKPVKVTKNGFDVEYKTWKYGKAKMVLLNWTAFGGL